MPAILDYKCEKVLHTRDERFIFKYCATEGWVPFGSPFSADYDNTQLYQAFVKYNTTDSDEIKTNAEKLVRDAENRMKDAEKCLVDSEDRAATAEAEVEELNEKIEEMTERIDQLSKRAFTSEAMLNELSNDGENDYSFSFWCLVTFTIIMGVSALSYYSTHSGDRHTMIHTLRVRV